MTSEAEKEHPELNDADREWAEGMKIDFFSHGGRIRSSNPVPRKRLSVIADEWLRGDDRKQNTANLRYLMEPVSEDRLHTVAGGVTAIDRASAPSKP